MCILGTLERRVGQRKKGLKGADIDQWGGSWEGRCCLKMSRVRAIQWGWSMCKGKGDTAISPVDGIACAVNWYKAFCWWELTLSQIIWYGCKVSHSFQQKHKFTSLLIYQATVAEKWYSRETYTTQPTFTSFKKVASCPRLHHLSQR